MRITYHKWFKLDPLGTPGWYRQPPSRLKQAKNLLSFRVGAHALRVNTARRQGVDWQDRTCMRCSAADLALLDCAVDDEHHMILNALTLQAVETAVSRWLHGCSKPRGMFSSLCPETMVW